MDRLYPQEYIKWSYNPHNIQPEDRLTSGHDMAATLLDNIDYSLRPLPSSKLEQDTVYRVFNLNDEEVFEDVTLLCKQLSEDTDRLYLNGLLLVKIKGSSNRIPLKLSAYGIFDHISNKFTSRLYKIAEENKNVVSIPLDDIEYMDIIILNTLRGFKRNLKNKAVVKSSFTQNSSFDKNMI